MYEKRKDNCERLEKSWINKISSQKQKKKMYNNRSKSNFICNMSNKLIILNNYKNLKII